MRTWLHVICSVLLWGVFFYYWELVAGHTVGHGTLLAIRVLSLVVLIGSIGTILWIAHNLRLARQDRRRAPAAPRAEILTQDALGRRIVAPPLDELKRAAVIEITLGADHKTYEPVPSGYRARD